MGFLTQLFYQFFYFFRPKDKQFARTIHVLTGLFPKNISLYRLAIRHSSAAQSQKQKEHNERLEYLGDSVLGFIVAEFLFKKYPFKEEGFLTEIRSRMVNGEHLAQLSKTIGLSALIDHDKRQKGGQLQRSSMYGDALEALVAAVYLDHGFGACRDFVLKKLLFPHVDLSLIVEQNANFKSQIIEWAQKSNRKIAFDIVAEKGSSHNREFVAELRIDGEVWGLGKGLSKKKAEQAAAEQALSKIEH